MYVNAFQRIAEGNQRPGRRHEYKGDDRRNVIFGRERAASMRRPRLGAFMALTCSITY